MKCLFRKGLLQYCKTAAFTSMESVTSLGILIVEEFICSFEQSDSSWHNVMHGPLEVFIKPSPSLLGTRPRRMHTSRLNRLVAYSPGDGVNEKAWTRKSSKGDSRIVGVT